MLLTEVQLDQIAKTFGLKREFDVLPVRDGTVVRDSKVWWRGIKGPVLITAGEDWSNIQQFPHLYQFEQPRTKVTYMDEEQ